MTGIKKIGFLLGLMVMAPFLAAQIPPEYNLSSGKLKKFSINAQRYGDHYTALQYYSAYAKRKPKNEKVQYNLAELYEKNRDYKSAAESYLNAYELDMKNPDALYNHIRMLKMSGKVQEAADKFQSFNNNLRKMGYDNSWKRILRTAIADCDSALVLMADSVPVRITNAGEIINGPHQEFAPIPLDENQLVFGSIRESEIKYFSVDSMSTRRQLYIASRNEDGWQNVQHWDVPFNTPDYHVVNGSFSKDGNLFVFTRCNENWKKDMTCKLWFSEKNNGDWLPEQLMPEEINGGGTIVTQPALAYDQNKERNVMYFVSNAPDGQGGFDIYYAYFDKRRNTWRKPRNLGRRINGEGDEVTPFYNQKEKKLYYSSSSFQGMGGLDIYTSRGELNKFNAPENIGYPFNSTVDDFYFVMNEDRESGFFVSNRSGGYQMMNETCCDDIYEFKISDVVHVEMEGLVMRVSEEEYVSGEGDKLSSKSLNTEFLDDVQVDVYLKEDEAEILMDRFKVGDDGTFKISLESEKDYKVVLSKDGFFTNHIHLDTKGVEFSKNLLQNVGLSKISGLSVVVPNVQYEFGSDKLDAESLEVLDKGILNLLLENPQVVLEISSHTDSIGSADFNLKLSERRATNVVNYLIGKGVDPSQLQAKGYGVTRPIAPNTFPDGTDNPEGRAENRRTEIKLLETRTLDSPIDDDDE